jgi:hypothetical protein
VVAFAEATFPEEMLSAQPQRIMDMNNLSLDPPVNVAF